MMNSAHKQQSATLVSPPIKIVGHRGAAGIELENTMPGFIKAKQLGVDAIELDVQLTTDNQFVVYHETFLQLLLNRFGRTKRYSYAELQQILLANGQTVPLLRDVLAATVGIDKIVDIKIDTHIKELCDVLNDFPTTNFTFVSSKPKALIACKKYRPDISALSERHYLPFSFSGSVYRHKLDGVNMNYRLLNPFTYRLAQRHSLQIMAYTINDVGTAERIRRRYPGVWICTNHPDRFISALRNTDN